MLLLVCAVSACQFQILSGSGSEAGAGEDGDGSGTESPRLGSEGLIARYFLAEASIGQAPLEAVDSAHDPVNLPISYASSNVMNYTAEEGLGRGIQWIALGAAGGPTIAVDGTKFATRLQGTTEATLEFVLRVHAGHGSYSRLLTIDDASGEHGPLSALFGGSSQYIEVNFNLNTVFYPRHLGSENRAVLNVVYDTAEPVASDRMRVYINGQRIASSSGTFPLLNETLDLGTGRSLVIGNSGYFGRAVNGSIYYTAIYNRALSEDEISQHVSILSQGDDSETGQ